jgi:prefoldin subunit 5
VALARFGKQIETLRRRKADINAAISELKHTMALVEGMLHDREISEPQPAEPMLQAAE